MRKAAGRPNQKSRTRKDLLEAAARLGRLGRKPSLEEIAEEALVSRATAYRYFPNVEALLVEASFHIAIPEPDDLFGKDADGDPVQRMQRVDAALHDVILANEVALRTMLVHSLQQGMREPGPAKAPVRQNRRTPLIEAALEPIGDRLDARALATLGDALALIVGPEAFVVARDVLRLGDRDARAVKRWAIRALIETAMADAGAARTAGRRRDGHTAGGPPSHAQAPREGRPARPPGAS